MMVDFLAWFRRRPSSLPPLHRHDHEMVFDQPNPLDYRLVCKCGDEARDMPDALRRMGLL